MRYARPQIRRSHVCPVVHQDAAPETKTVPPVHVRRARGMTRCLAMSLMVASQVCASNEVVAQAPDPSWLPVPVRHPLQGLNRLGRLMGWGLSDGYHASIPGKANPTHDLPPHSAWITEPVSFIDHPSTARILHEIHDVNRNRQGFFDPYIDHLMMSPPPTTSTHPQYTEGMASPPSTHVQFQPTDTGIGHGGSWEISPEPLPTNTAPLAIPAPQPRNPREQVTPKTPDVRRQPSVLDSLPNPQRGPQQSPTRPLSPATRTPSPNQQPITQQPIRQPYTSPIDGYSGVQESPPQLPSPTDIPTPAIQSDPLSFPLIPEGTQDPLPQPRAPRGNLLPDPAVPPGVDPLDDFRRSPADLRQTSNLPQQRTAPKRVPRISSRIVEPTSH